VLLGGGMSLLLLVVGTLQFRFLVQHALATEIVKEI